MDFLLCVLCVSARDEGFMLHPEQKRIYQSMTPEQKLRVALDLYHSAREVKAAGEPDKSPATSVPFMMRDAPGMNLTVAPAGTVRV